MRGNGFWAEARREVLPHGHQSISRSGSVRSEQQHLRPKDRPPSGLRWNWPGASLLSRSSIAGDALPPSRLAPGQFERNECIVISETPHYTGKQKLECNHEKDRPRRVIRKPAWLPEIQGHCARQRHLCTTHSSRLQLAGGRDQGNPDNGGACQGGSGQEIGPAPTVHTRSHGAQAAGRLAGSGVVHEQQVRAGQGQDQASCLAQTKHQKLKRLFCLATTENSGSGAALPSTAPLYNTRPSDSPVRLSRTQF